MSAVQVIRSVTPARHGQLRELYASTWWAASQSDEDVGSLLAGSSAVVGLVDVTTDRLVGFTRVLTDGRVVALVLDVIVHPDVRGTGLGDRLMREVLAPPELERVGSVELVCQPDLVGFYARFGFTENVGGSRLMRRSSDPRLVPGTSMR